MTLLFDENLSSSLARRSTDFFPEAAHVRDLGLARADDNTVWSHVKKARMTIVSKDSDFRQRAFLWGHPPKVISIALGNCTTSQIEALLRARALDVANFLADPEASVMLLP